MTQEEKAKRYDEALERAREIHFSKDEMEYIFPELKENEDERIRKWLEEHIEAMPYNSIEFKDVKRIDVLYWLEKQGEQKFADGTFVNVDDVREDFIQEVYRVLDADSTNDRANQIIDAFDSLPTVTIEKQGENHDDKYNITGIKSKHAEGKLGEMLKKIKSTDKVEPKFHEGQWIIWQDKCYKVNYNGCGYELIDQNGLSTSLEYGTIDENAHLFSIKDAKDGDVLQLGEVTAIFKKYIGQEKCICYCSISEDGDFEIPIKNGEDNIYGCTDTTPATIEQREQLEKSMADAGYTFDFDKKELKKIENEIEIPFGAKDSELIEESYYISKGFHAEIDDDKVVIKKGENPTAWSEEDEKTLNSILSCIDQCQIEDIEARYNGNHYVNPERYEPMFDWLKSIKERYTWKPSDAQMIVLNDVITNGHLSNANERILKGLQEQLKKLK